MHKLVAGEDTHPTIKPKSAPIRPSPGTCRGASRRVGQHSASARNRKQRQRRRLSLGVGLPALSGRRPSVGP